MNNDVKLAVLYQAQQPPIQNGIKKPMKPGGYADSGADIAYTLQKAGVTIVTPTPNADVLSDMDWVYPDTKEGIEAAIHNGATHLWLNTVLFASHPIIHFHNRGLRIVGQLPELIERYDDKWLTNNLLRANGLPVPPAQLVTFEEKGQLPADIPFPLVAKPIRGRGSAGVTLINKPEQYAAVLEALFAEDKYGTTVYIEPYLPGEEVTITVMPPGRYLIQDTWQEKETHWALAAVKRFNHQEGIAPYNGTVPVVHNSKVISDEEEQQQSMIQLYQQCVIAATLVESRAPIRIDCRANSEGAYFLFDLNMKPNITGASRPHRGDQDSLTALAARKAGWSYAALLQNIVLQSWRL